MLGMRKRGHRIILATRSLCTLASKAEKAGIEVVYIPFRSSFDLHSIIEIYRLIRKEKVNIVNTHSGIDSWVGGLGAKLAGVPLVRTRHLNIPLKRVWHNFVHYLPSRIVTCGEAIRQKLILEQGFPPAQLISIPTGIDFSSFRPDRTRAEIRSELRIAPESFVVLMVAVIRRVKRYDLALQVFADFHRRHPHALLVICGDGPMKGAIEQLAQDLNLSGSVRFLGHRDDIPDIMQSADTLLLTSDSEGVPQSVTQALGMAVPVVATSVGGVPELVIDGVTGLLVPPNNEDATVNALERFAGDPEFRRALAIAGRDYVHSRLSLDAMLDATELAYREILAENH